MIEMVCKCDECPAIRKEANHWFMGYATTDPAFILEMWRPDHTPAYRDYCGQQCVHAAIDRFMSTGSIEKPTKETAE